MKALIYPY